MFTISWQRPLILAATSLVLVTGGACAAQAAESHAPAAGVVSFPAGQPENCVLGGAGGEGGKGGEGGRGGKPGQPGEPGKPGRIGCFRFADLPDKEKSDLTVVDRVHIVMALLTDDSDETKKQIAEKYKISTDQIDEWRKQYLAGDWFGLMGSNPFC